MPAGRSTSVIPETASSNRSSSVIPEAASIASGYPGPSVRRGEAAIFCAARFSPGSRLGGRFAPLAGMTECKVLSSRKRRAARARYPGPSVKRGEAAIFCAARFSPGSRLGGRSAPLAGMTEFGVLSSRKRRAARAAIRDPASGAAKPPYFALRASLLGPGSALGFASLGRDDRV